MSLTSKMTRCTYDFNSSTDSQFTENEDDLDDITFLEACMDCDEDALYDIIQDGVTVDQVNERDKSGRTGMSYACANGFLPILELLFQLEEVDSNLPDKEGNTPLIFAAQAGHADVVNYLLQNFRRTRIDQCNLLGFTALMKAAIQGRTRCAKLLLFAGANPNRRDHGRGLCAEEWARFTCRHACADAISKYVHSKKYFLKKTFILTREKWSSEPDILARSKVEKPKGNWISRHLSFKKKRGRGGGGVGGISRDSSPSRTGSLKETARSSSSPMLTTEPVTPPGTPSPMRRPSCIDGVVPVSIVPRLKITAEQSIQLPLLEEKIVPKVAPPTILQTDFDEEKEGKHSQVKVS